jgi:hypothetical protein
MAAELSQDPDALFRTTVPVEELCLLGRRLGDPVESVDLARVVTTSPGGPLPEGSVSLRFSNGKWFCVRAGGEAEFPLADQIEAVVRHGGVLHLDQGYKYRIKAGVIVELAIHGGVLGHYQRYTKRQVIRRLGWPSFVDEVWDGPELHSSRLYFAKRRLLLACCDFNFRWETVNLGETRYCDDGRTIRRSRRGRQDGFPSREVLPAGPAAELHRSAKGRAPWGK